MRLTTHLSFNGECESAFRFYEHCFRGQIVTMLSYGDSPAAAQVPPGWHDKIVHATLHFGSNLLMGADLRPEVYERPAGFQLILGLTDVAESERLFNALAENGTVRIPLQKTFWAERFGVVIDRFGVPWEVNCTEAQDEAP